jgi:heptosyltransferase-1
MAKILIVRLGAMGDILHALPAVTSIRAALPDATIGWLVEENWSELLTARGHKPDPLALSPPKPVVNLIHTVNTKRWRKRLFDGKTIAEIRGDFKRLREAHYDIALDFQGNAKSSIAGWLSSAPEMAGYVDPRESIARIFYKHTFARQGEHVIEQNHQLAKAALAGLLPGGELPLVAPQLPCDPAAKQWLDEQIKTLGIASYAVVTPGAGWGAKQWPPQRFGEVAQGLAKHNLRTLVNTAPGEESLAQAVVDASAGTAFSIKCTIGQLITLTRGARIFIGGDTGPLHIASALGIPVVAIFGPTDPARTGPYGSPAIALRSPESETTSSHHDEPEQGLLKITAEEVISAARHLLTANPVTASPVPTSPATASLKPNPRGEPNG